MKRSTTILSGQKLKAAIALLFVLVTIFNCTTQAQWIKTSGPKGANVNVFYDNGTFLFAGTSSNGVFRSTDHGLTWAAANLGMENLTVFSFTSDQTYIYAGTSSGVFRSPDGLTWSAANTGIETEYVGSMTVGGGFVFAGTVSDGVFRSSDHGTTWTMSNGGALNGTDMLAMCYINNLLIAEGDNFIFKSMNNGQSWAIDQGNTQFYPINHFFVLGDTLFACAYGGVFHSYNGGKTWSKFLNVDNQLLANLLGFAFSNGIVYTADQFGMFQSANYGLSWTKISGTGLRPGSRFSYDFTMSGNNFLIGMDELGVFLSSNTGATWSQSINGFTPSSSIDNCMVAVGDTICTGTHTDGIYETSSNGNSWKKKGNNSDTLSNAVIFALLHPAPNILLAGTCGDGLYRSVNNGKKWTHITKGLPFTPMGNYECDQSLALSGTTIILATTAGIYYSKNNGATWKASNVAGSFFSAEGVGANGNVAIASVTQNAFPFHDGIYRSTNNGVTWTFVTDQVQGAISIASDGVDHFYAGTFLSNFRSGDNGLTFTEIGNGIPVNSGGFSIKVVDINNIFIGNSAGVYFSNNQGTSFTDASLGLDPTPNNSVQGLQANSTYLFAGLFRDGVWKRPLSDFGISAPQKTDVVTGDFNLNVYPNPFSNQTVIYYHLSKSGNVSITLYDVTGKIVYQSNEFAEAGNYSKALSGNFAKGIYFLKLQSTQQVAESKIVVQ